MIETHKPDVVLLDLNLGGESSLPVVKALAKKKVRTRILILSMYNDPAYVRAALAAGANGYIVKTLAEDALLQAIRDVHTGKLVIDLDDRELSKQVFRPDSNPTMNALQELSDREQEVLILLGNGYTNQAIAEKLDISPKTVATYRARIGEKLGLRSTTDFVQYVRETGQDQHQSTPFDAES
jgi:two-component system response regulator NreC